MKRLKKLLISLMAVCLVLSQFTFVSFAVTSNSSNGLKDLVAAASKTKGGTGSGTSLTIGGRPYNGASWDYSSRTYKCSDGGYKVYSELAKNDIQQPIDENTLGTLTTGAKNQFLTDYYNAGQSVINWSKKNNYESGITEEAGTNWLERIQSTAGVGSQLMTTLMAQTKPDYITANRLYAPFSGTVGTILGIVAILIMAFLAITMVLDLAYIAIPAFQLFIEGDGQGGGQGGGKKKSFISHEAMEAVQMAEGGQGGGGQSGSSNKLAVSIYFKKRVFMLVVLGICLLYLVSGNIFSLVGWFIDLLSGFLGF